MDIKGKIAVITGASKGIGRQIALDLAKAGAKVSISARNKELLDDLASDIAGKGGESFVFAGDMSREDEMITFVQQTADTFGKIDILINNAGVGHFCNIAEMTTQQWDNMFDLNVRGLFIMTRETLPYLRAAGESVIVNIASLAGKNAFPTGAGYAATKHAVIGFSRCLMLEERKNGVRVITINPGSVNTNFADHQPGLLAPEKKALKPTDVSTTIIHAIQMPQRAMISEIDIRPTQP